MKKILAMMLAMMLALGCVGAFAEEAQNASFTAYCETEINQEALAALLPALGMDESMVSTVQSIVPLISNLSEKVSFDGSALQFDMLLKDTAIATVGARLGEAGAEIVSNLIPSYKLTVSAETVNSLLSKLTSESGELSLNFDPEALMGELTGIMNKYMDSFAAAITAGEPEACELEYDGYKFNVVTPVEVDVKALASTIANLLKDVISNETIMGALTSAGSMANLDMSSLQETIAKLENPTDEDLPEVNFVIYSIVADGQVLETPTLQCMDLIDKNDETGVVNLTLYQNGEAVYLEAVAEKQNVEASIYINPADLANAMSLNVTANGTYIGLALGVEQSEAVAFYVDLYFMDAEKPLLSTTITLMNGAELTVSFEEEGKTVLAVEQLMQDSDGKALSDLLSDLTSNGLGTLLANAMQAMPQEVGALMTLFMGGGATQELPEEAPAANE